MSGVPPAGSSRFIRRKISTITMIRVKLTMDIAAACPTKLSLRSYMNTVVVLVS